MVPGSWSKAGEAQEEQGRPRRAPPYVGSVGPLAVWFGGGLPRVGFAQSPRLLPCREAPGGDGGRWRAWDRRPRAGARAGQAKGHGAGGGVGWGGAAGWGGQVPRPWPCPMWGAAVGESGRMRGSGSQGWRQQETPGFLSCRQIREQRLGDPRWAEQEADSVGQAWDPSLGVGLLWVSAPALLLAQIPGAQRPLLSLLETAGSRWGL